MGHVRDLPKRKLGLDVANGYTPSYEVVPTKKETIGELKKAAAQGRDGLPGDRPRPRGRGDRLAPPAGARPARRPGPPRDVPRDHRARRQGGLRPRPARSTWTWSTPSRPGGSSTGSSAISSARCSGRRSRGNLSAGRVQSVAVRLIADREREIRAFVTEEYWKITATVSPAGSTGRGRPVRGRAWPSTTGPSSRPRTRPTPTPSATPWPSAPYSVAKVDEIEKLDKADPPFKTSTLQQQAAIRLRFSGKRTMKIAQELYEGIDVDGTGPGRADHLHADRQPPGLRRGDRPRSATRSRPSSAIATCPPSRSATPPASMRRRPTRPSGPTDLALTPGPDQGLTCRHDQFRLYQLIYAPVRRQPDDPGRLHGHRRLGRRRRRASSRRRARS